MKVKSGRRPPKLTIVEEELEKSLKEALKSKDKNKVKLAFSDFFDYYLIYLKRLCLDKLDDQQCTYDVLMDTFSRFFNSLINDRINECYKSYLMTVFNFRCKKYNLYYKKHNANIETFVDITEVPDEEEYTRLMNVVSYLDAVLTPLEKDVVLRHIIRGDTLSEIKDDMKLVGKDIYKIYNKAIYKLRVVVEEEYEEYEQ